jgi:GAF domain-containing protein
MIFEQLKLKVETIVSDNSKSINTRLLNICQLLETHLDYYDWVGFYFKNGTKNELKLECYVGEETNHTIIPFGKGICGQVAISNENFMVSDVAAEDNYIACSINVKSEVVIPIFKDDENIGQIDIDSHTINAFSKADEDFLEFVCTKVSTII